ncbi:hypothetical protein J4711_13665 [Staphylococcus epidermidis]|nr:hypothetical protein [Staphylococcus epidermidis]
MGFEIYVLAIVNELYFRRFDAEAALIEGRKRLAQNRTAQASGPSQAAQPV